MNLKILSVSIVFLISSFALAQNKTPEMNDPRLKRMYRALPPEMKALFDAHSSFPGSLAAPRMFYLPYIEELTKSYHALSLALPINKDFKPAEFAVRYKRKIEKEFKVIDVAALDKWNSDLLDSLVSIDGFDTEDIDDHNFDARPLVARELVSTWFKLKEPNAKPKRIKRKVQTLLSLFFIINERTNVDDEGTLWQNKITAGKYEGEIDFFEEHAIFDGTVDYLLSLSESELNMEERAHFFELSSRLLRKKAKFLRAQTVDFEKLGPQIGERLLIKEISPDVSLLRGLVGNDCSTKVSCGFSFSPNERVFYVMDNNRTLGYIATSEVFVNGKISLFLHTIAGPDINPIHTSMILEGFVLNVRNLGYQSIYLPEDHRIGENVNYAAIRVAMHSYAEGVELTELDWIDQPARDIIMENGSDGYYDSPERNSLGRVLDITEPHIASKYKSSSALMMCSKIL